MVPPRFRRATTSFIDCLLPEQCPVCAREVHDRRTICRDCEHLVRPCTRTLDNGLRVTSVLPYCGDVADAITAMKYGNQPWRARAFGRLLAEQLCHLLPMQQLAGRSPAPGAVAVPVPISADRARERGYNQAAIICAAAAGPLSLRHVPSALQRIDSLGSQTRASRRERMTRGLGFKARPINGPTVLVDDVLTTGATLMACADALRHVGEHTLPITAFTVAWTPAPSDNTEQTCDDPPDRWREGEPDPASARAHSVGLTPDEPARS